MRPVPARPGSIWSPAASWTAHWSTGRFYRDGHRDAQINSYVEALNRARRGEGFVWIGLFEPNERQLAIIGQEFGLHPLALEDATEAHQRPKLERYDDTLFAVLKTVRYVPHGDLTATSEVVETGEVMVFCGPGFVITVRHGEHSELTGLRQELEKQPEAAGGRTGRRTARHRGPRGGPLPGGRRRRYRPIST